MGRRIGWRVCGSLSVQLTAARCDSAAAAAAASSIYIAHLPQKQKSNAIEQQQQQPERHTARPDSALFCAHSLAKRVIYFRFAIFSNYLSKNETSARLLLTAALSMAIINAFTISPLLARSLPVFVCTSITLFTVHLIALVDALLLPVLVQFAVLRFTHIRFIRKHHQIYVLSSTNLFCMDAGWLAIPQVLFDTFDVRVFVFCSCFLSHLCVNFQYQMREPIK